MEETWRNIASRLLRLLIKQVGFSISCPQNPIQAQVLDLGTTVEFQSRLTKWGCEHERQGKFGEELLHVDLLEPPGTRRLLQNKVERRVYSIQKLEKASLG